MEQNLSSQDNKKRRYTTEELYEQGKFFLCFIVYTLDRDLEIIDIHDPNGERMYPGLLTIIAAIGTYMHKEQK